MNRKFRTWTIENPEVLAVVRDVYRFSRNLYFKIDANGTHYKFAVNQALATALPTNSREASILLRRAEDAGIIVQREYTPGVEATPTEERESGKTKGSKTD